jgi:hypothetical protein
MNDTVQFFGFTTTLLELLSFILSVVTVALNIRQIHWAWLFSILSSGLYASVFLMRGYMEIWDCNGSLLLFLCGAGFCGGEALMEAASCLYLHSAFASGACRHCMGSGICGVGMVFKELYRYRCSSGGWLSDRWQLAWAGFVVQKKLKTGLSGLLSTSCMSVCIYIKT